MKLQGVYLKKEQHVAPQVYVFMVKLTLDSNSVNETELRIPIADWENAKDEFALGDKVELEVKNKDWK